MKRCAFICALCIALSGCGATDGGSASDPLSLDTASIAQNTETIEKILSENSWNYDKESMTFGNDYLLSGTGDNFGLICEASNGAGIDTAKLEKGAEQTMLAAVRLINADMSDAGTAYFAFSKRELLCGYYVYNDAFYSLANKYPFEYFHPFSGAENKDKTSDITALTADAVFEDAAAVYGGEAAVISGSSLMFYSEGKKDLKKTAEIEFDELAPADAAVSDKYICVLLDSYKNAERLSESDFEDYDNKQEIVLTKSEKIVFVDKDGDYVQPALPLDLSIYTSVALDGDTVAAARNSAVDLFALENGAWVKKKRLNVNSDVDKLRIADMDGDGANEYIVSDGVNISVYKKDSQLQLAWATKFSSSKIKDIYVGDLNGDGIKEIYANELYSDNSSGFALRYVIGENGFEVFGGNIVSGESAYYAVGDIDNDGKDDCIVIKDDEMMLNHIK